MMIKAVLLTGIALLIGCFGTTLAAIWSHGDTAARLGGTALALGMVGAVLTMIGTMPE